MLFCANTLFFVVLAVGIIVAAIFIGVRVKGNTVKALLLKAASSVLFVICGVIASYAAFQKTGEGLFGTLVVLGLIFGMLGDIWLDLKFIYPKDNDAFTFAGFACFALGHVFYVSAVLSRFSGGVKLLWIIIPAAIGVIVAVGMCVGEKPMKMNYGKFKLIVSVYSAVLAFMTFLSGSLAIVNRFSVPALTVMFLGGVFFMISDLILSGTYFGEGKNRPVDIVVNHATYYIAQFLIASAIMCLAV